MHPAFRIWQGPHLSVFRQRLRARGQALAIAGVAFYALKELASLSIHSTMSASDVMTARTMSAAA